MTENNDMSQRGAGRAEGWTDARALATARAEGWRAGQEDMRERAARKAAEDLWRCPNSGCTRIVDGIRALPLTPEPQEPKQ